MAKYHINLEGNPGRCSAQVGNCPFGSEDEHYHSKHEARQAYEKAHSPEITAFEVMNKKFSKEYAASFKYYAEAIDAEKENFLENASGDTVYGVLSIANNLGAKKQEFIDQNVRTWFDKKKDQIWKQRDGESEEEYVSQWREAKNEVTSAYISDYMNRKISNSKNTLAFIARDSRNYRAFATAIMAKDLTTARDGYIGRDITDHGLYRLPLPQNYSLEELKAVGEINPQGITFAAEKISHDSDEIKNLYTIVAKNETDYSQDWQPRRREAIKAVLGKADLPANLDMFEDASQKINKANGLATKDMAKIMKDKLKNIDNKLISADPVKAEKIRAIVRSIRETKDDS